MPSGSTCAVRMIGTKLANRYEILDELGRGGMGVVYRARDPLLDREVAVKLVPPTLLTPEGEVRFLREAQVIAKMDHAAIVPVHDIGRHDGSLFFVMPIVRGTNLRSFLREHSLRLGDVVDVGIQVAEALDYSHAEGVVHRDVKPENVMVARGERDGVRVRVMDFGLAHASFESQLTRITQKGMLIGTVSYLSPEQVDGHVELDGTSDIYSLGVVLYECLLGEPPFVGDVQSVLYRIRHEIPQPPSALGAEVDDELEAIAMACLAKEPTQRPARAKDVAEALARFRGRLTVDDLLKPVGTSATRVVRASRHQRHASPFIGREKELAELQWRLNAAVAGECQFAVVSGDAGMGKSRLLEEIEKLARARKVRVLHGRFVEQDHAFPYQGFCEVIQDFFVTKEHSSSSAGTPELADLAPDLVSLFPVLAEIAEIRSSATGDARRTDLVPAKAIEDRTAVYELIARAIARIVAGRPVMLVFEDLHKADVSIEALQYLVRRLGPTPTLIVGSYRPEGLDRRHPLARMLDGFAGDRRFAAVHVGPMTPSEHRAFIEAIVGGPKLGEAPAQRLYDATEGNPFFTQELVRSLIDSGGIAEDETGALNLSTEMGISSDALPATIQQAVEKRVEGLPDELHDVLSMASVLGRTFEFRDLQMLVDGKLDTEEAVDKLVRLGLVQEERESRVDRLAFASGVVRDVLYTAIPRRRRRSLHRRYAEGLEARNSGRLERVYSQLAHHYSQGDVAEKAVRYGLEAATRSLAAFSSDEAARAAKLALEFLEDEWEGDRALEGEARFLLASAYRLDGNVDGALREAERAVKVFDETGSTVRAADALLLAAETAWAGRRVEETRQFVNRGIDTARKGDSTENLVELLELAATVANLRAEYALAKEYLEQVELVTAQPGETDSAPVYGGRLVVATTSAVLAAEPVHIKITDEEEVLANVFEPLVTTDALGSLIPALCEKWDIRHGGLTVRLTLRRGLMFSDGTPVRAADVRASFERSIRAAKGALPAAFAAVRGALAYATGETDGADGHLEGVAVVSDYILDVHLDEPLPIYPALLTDASASLVRVVRDDDGTEHAIGTGPFKIVSQDASRVVLAANRNFWRGHTARLDEIEFLPVLDAVAIADGLRTGSIDVGRGLRPEDFEQMLRDPRMRQGFVEVAQKDVCLIVFNCNRPAGRSAALRRALAGVLRTRDLVWSTVGRLAQPAIGLIPPGMLGHDPGRRRLPLSWEQARALVELSGIQTPLRLRAAVPPGLQGWSSRIAASVFEVWRDLGVEVTLGTSDMDEYVASWNDSGAFDLIMCLWHADYDDPDNFTHTLFKSGTGLFHRYFCSPETDELAEEARVEARASVRETLYRKFENLVVDNGIVIPLCHELDYRIAGPKVRRLRLQSTSPFVNYAEVEKVESAPPRAPAIRQGGIVTIPIAMDFVDSLDPSVITTEPHAEMISNVVETLTRVADGARVVPWLASQLSVEGGGRRLLFKLRENVRFHDGRRLTARDVRFTFERLLQRRESKGCSLLVPINGAQAFVDGRASELAGFQIHSSSEFVIELEKPVSFFPVVLTDPCTGIVPEGSDDGARSSRNRVVGTGPFRMIKYEPGVQLEMERNPDYWRDGYPLADGLVFVFNTSFQAALKGFRAGNFSLAYDLLPADFEALRHDSGFASTYRETPSLSTAYVAFNTKRGPLADLDLRRRLLRALDVPTTVRRALGRYTTPAYGFIPPGLAGYDSTRRMGPLPVSGSLISGEEITVRAAVSKGFLGRLAQITDEIVAAFRNVGVTVQITSTRPELRYIEMGGAIDLVISSWGADYPDADSFAYGLLHSKEGFLGYFCGSPELDTAIEAGRAETDPARRHEIYRQVEQIIARDALLLPLFHPTKYRFARPEVEGLSVSALGFPCVAYDRLRVRR
jgi:ABC-type transport system substrate-binding protein